MPILMCPNCNAGMQEITRNDVQIDMCPQCRGVWLDRGELEKLLNVVRQDIDERSAWREPAPQQHAPSPPGYGRGHSHDYDYRHHKRRKSRFEEIFDIFD